MSSFENRTSRSTSIEEHDPANHLIHRHHNPSQKRHIQKRHSMEEADENGQGFIASSKGYAKMSDSDVIAEPRAMARASMTDEEDLIMEPDPYTKELNHELHEMDFLHHHNGEHKDEEENGSTSGEYHGGSGEELERTVGLFGGTSLIVGVMIGSGIFSSPGAILDEVGSVGAALIVWTVSGMLALVGALCYVELGTSIERSSGGEYAYLLHTYGELVAFTYTVSLSFAGKPGSLAIISTVFGDYLGRLLSGSGKEESPAWLAKGLGLSQLLCLFIINSMDTKKGLLLQGASMVAKLIVVAAVIVTGLIVMGMLFSKDPSDLDETQQAIYDQLTQPFFGTSTNPGSWALALFAGLWAYDGWNNLNYVAEEVVNPTRNLPLAICIAVPSVTFLYVLVNLSYLSVLTVEQAATTNAIAMEWGLELMGPVGGSLIPIGVAISALGAANGSLFTSARIIFASSRAGQFPAWTGRVHPVRGTMINALAIQVSIASIMVLAGNFKVLVNFFSFSAWVFYGLTAASLIVLRYREPDRPRPFKVWLPLAFLFCLITLFLIVVAAYEAPKESAAATVFMILATPLYYFYVKPRKEKRLAQAHTITGGVPHNPWRYRGYIRVEDEQGSDGLDHRRISGGSGGRGVSIVDLDGEGGALDAGVEL
eukprot:Clim_evm13s77 gene=Clim_evmTU13s77